MKRRTQGRRPNAANKLQTQTVFLECLVKNYGFFLFKKSITTLIDNMYKHLNI